MLLRYVYKELFSPGRVYRRLQGCGRCTLCTFAQRPAVPLQLVCCGLCDYVQVSSYMLQPGCTFGLIYGILIVVGAVGCNGSLDHYVLRLMAGFVPALEGC